MKLFVEKGELMLPDDFSFEIERNNPFFSDDGTASVPVTLPATIDTRAKLGFPDRINRAYRFTKKIPAVFRHQMFNKRCSLVIDSFTNESGFTASLAFEESQMYAELQNTNLKELFKDEIYEYEHAKSPAYIAEKLYRFNRETEDSHPEFIAFPVALNKQEDGSFFVANEPNEEGTNFIHESRVITIAGAMETVPTGYGVIPFIRLSHFLEKTFELCGYKVVRNDLGGRPYWDIVVLNNCIDAICGQKGIRYRDTVPSMTFGELIEWLKDKFCAAVYIKNTEVSIVLFKNIYEDFPDMDLSQYVKDDYVVQYPDAKQLKLECNTSIDGAEPAFKTLKELEHGANKISEPDDWWNMSTEEGVYYIEPTGQIMKRYATIDEATGTTVYKTEPLGSICIPFQNKTSRSEDVFSSQDEFVPQIILDSKWAVSDLHSALPYIGERLHNHTTVLSENNDDIEPAAQSLMICWCIHNTYARGGNSQPYDNLYLNRSYFYDHSLKTIVPLPALTPNGLYDYCWRQYDAIIINSAPTVDINLNIPIASLLSLDLSKPKLFNGQKALIISYSMEITASSMRCLSMKLQLLPEYRNAMSSEQPSDIPEGYQLVWSLYIGAPMGYETYGSKYPVYTMDDAPSYIPSYIGETALKRQNQSASFWSTPNAKPMYEWEEYFIAVLEEIE